MSSTIQFFSCSCSGCSCVLMDASDARGEGLGEGSGEGFGEGSAGLEAEDGVGVD